MVILALSLSVLLSAHDTALRGATALDSQLQARLLAQSLLAQHAQSRVPQSPAQGRSGPFAWTVAMAPLEDGGRQRRDGAPDPWSLHQVTVTVAWAPRRHITLTTLRLMSTQ
jgi:hypothetical protein